jgi:aryl-alcohol dehydrogenase-like predicted oxidoreductase
VIHRLSYSLWERTPEGELLPMAEALGMGVLPWSPLRRGQLPGTYVRDGGAPADSLRAGRMEGLAERDRAVIDAVARIAAEIGVSSAEVALAWVRSRPAVTSTLIGPARSAAHGIRHVELDGGQPECLDPSGGAQVRALAVVTLNRTRHG